MTWPQVGAPTPVALTGAAPKPRAKTWSERLVHHLRRTGQIRYVPDLEEHAAHDAAVMAMFRAKHPDKTPAPVVEWRPGDRLDVYVVADMATCSAIGGPFRTSEESREAGRRLARPGVRVAYLHFVIHSREELLAQVAAWAARQAERNRTASPCCGPAITRKDAA